METVTLENCPFCGSEAETVNKKTYFMVRCKDTIGCRAAICFKTNVLYSASDVAIACWNRRPGESQEAVL